MRTGILHPIGVRKRLCVSVWGVNSRFIFQELESILVFLVCFCKRNCYFEYRIRILCIELYMVTYLKNIFRHFFVVVVVVVSSRRRRPLSVRPSRRPSRRRRPSSVRPSRRPSRRPSSSSSVVVVVRRPSSSVVVVRRPSSVVVIRPSCSV